jgi:prephenate dehydrogenase
VLVIVTVIGGAGRMGSWCARFLKANGYTVIVTDKNVRVAETFAKRYGLQFLRDQLVAVRRARLVVVATPTKVTSAILQQIIPELKQGALVVEMSSIKAPVLRSIRSLQRNGIDVLSIHPMFGRGVRTIKGRCILAVTVPKHREANRLLSIFRKKGARIVYCTPERQDSLASVILALPHFMNVSFVETLRSLRVNLDELNSVAGTTFQLQLLLAEEIYNEDFESELSILQDCRMSVLKIFNQHTSTLLKMAATQPGHLTRVLRSGRRLVATEQHFSTSYERFNAAVEASLS